MITFLVGLAASIPVSILANLSTPYFKDYLARFSESRREKRSIRMVHELARRGKYHENRAALASYLVRNAISLLALITGHLTFTLFTMITIIQADSTPSWLSQTLQLTIVALLYIIGFKAIRLVILYDESVEINFYIDKLKRRCEKMRIDYATIDGVAQERLDSF